MEGNLEQAIEMLRLLDTVGVRVALALAPGASASIMPLAFGIRGWPAAAVQWGIAAFVYWRGGQLARDWWRARASE